MAKPTDLPAWTSTTSSSIVEPSGAKKILGWLASERPPFSNFNWFWKTVSDWVQWLHDFESTAHAWGAAQEFDYQSLFTGNNNGGRTTLADALGSAHQFYTSDVGTSKRTLIWDTTPTSGTITWRLWLVPGASNITGNIEFTVNAYWNGTAWSHDDLTAGGFILSFGTLSNSIRIAMKTTTGGTWADTYDFTGGAAGWDIPLAEFGSATANRVSLGNMVVEGTLDALHGMNRCEQNCGFAAYTVTNQNLVWNFGPVSPVLLPRFNTGTVTDWTVKMSVAPTNPVTFTLSKFTGSLTTLDTMTITSPATTGTHQISGLMGDGGAGLGNYSAGNSLEIVATHSGGAITSSDITAIVRCRE
jgi:hypothetical protein